MNKKLFLNSFHLKLLAIIFMTIDHLGYHIFSNLNGFETITTICRTIGRLALPLFAFMIVEGIFHTRNTFKYLLRLFISAVLISGFLMVAKMSYAENIFIDLFLGATLVALLNLPKLKKLYSLIPLTIITLLLIFYQDIPNALCISYHFYGISLILGIYLATLLGNSYHKYLSSIAGMEEKDFEEILSKRKINNLSVLIFLVIFNLLCWIINSLVGGISSLVGTIEIQTFSIFAGLIILLYNGKRGYNALWWKYGCYLYYPIHVAIIYMIYLLL